MWSQTHSKFWTHWLERYKTHKCLWDVNSKDYNDKGKRNQAYKELICLAKEIEPDADLMFVRRRIDSFRNSFRRQSKKAIAARQNGFEYQCSAYYYNLLKSFLDPNPMDELEEYDSNTESQSDKDKFPNTFEISDEFADEDTAASIKKEFEEEPDDSIDKWDSYTDSHAEADVSPTKQRRPQIGATAKRFRSVVHPAERADKRNKDTASLQKLTQPVEDECELLGERFASHFRSMKPTQRLIAEKIISDVCIYGRMGKLNLDSGLMVDFFDESPDNYEQVDNTAEENEIQLYPDAYMNPI